MGHPSWTPRFASHFFVAFALWHLELAAALTDGEHAPHAPHAPPPLPPGRAPARGPRPSTRAPLPAQLPAASALLAQRAAIANWPTFAAGNALQGWERQQAAGVCSWSGVGCNEAGGVVQM